MSTDGPVARFGGDEFVLVIEEIPFVDVKKEAERIRMAVTAKALDALPSQHRLRLSGGVVWWDGNGRLENGWGLLKRAFEGMKLAKRRGRDQLVIPQHDGDQNPRLSNGFDLSPEITNVSIIPPMMHIDPFRDWLNTAGEQYLVAARVVERPRVATDHGLDRLDELERALVNAMQDELGSGSRVAHSKDTGIVVGSIKSPLAPEVAGLIEGRFSQIRDEARLPEERAICSPGIRGSKLALMSRAINELEKLELERRRDNRLPTPLAVSLRTLEFQQDSSSQADALIHLTEALIRWIAILIAADLRGKVPSLTVNNSDSLYGFLRPSGATMGQWLRILKRLFVAHRGLPADQSDLPSLWRGLRESEDHSLLYWPTLLKGIVDSRNKLAHGGAADKSGLSQRLIDEFRTPLLDALYGPLHFLEDIAPVYIESVDFADDGSASNVNFVYELRWLTGDRIVSPCVRVPSNQRMRKGQTLAYSRSDDRAILIEPLAICSHCRECNRNELYFIDHFDFERPQWVSLGIGHKYPPKGGRSDWDDAVMELCRTL